MVMDPFKKPRVGPEERSNLPEEETEVREVSDVSDASLDSTSEGVVEKVSELAQEKPGENQSSAQSKGQSAQKDQKKPQADFSDRMALRERLLKNAPKPTEMRSQVKKILLREHSRLQSDLRKYSRKNDFHMMGLVFIKLRAVVREIAEVAHASYDLLKEIWLRVVHHFA